MSSQLSNEKICAHTVIRRIVDELQCLVDAPKAFRDLRVMNAVNDAINKLNACIIEIQGREMDEQILPACIPDEL